MLAKSEYQVDQSDCCGNGCANCILDISPPKIYKCDLSDKSNVLLSYHLYTLLEYNQIHPKLLELHFKCQPEIADTNWILYIPPGHHLMMRARVPIADDSKSSVPCDSGTATTMIRPYSPFWSDISQLEFKILVNLNPDGLMSKYIEKLHPGDEVEFRGPVGEFQYEPNNCKNLLLICHGVAIAPILAIIQEVFNNDQDMTRIQLFACFENMQRILFRKEIIEYNRFWNFQSRIFLSRPEENFRSESRYKEDIVGERLNHAALRNYFESCKRSLTSVVSGSKEFQASFRNILLDIGLEASAIHLL